MDKLSINDFQQGQSETIDFEAIKSDSFIDVREALSPPPVALSIGSYTYKG